MEIYITLIHIRTRIHNIVSNVDIGGDHVSNKELISLDATRSVVLLEGRGPSVFVL